MKILLYYCSGDVNTEEPRFHPFDSLATICGIIFRAVWFHCQAISQFLFFIDITNFVSILTVTFRDMGVDNGSSSRTPIQPAWSLSFQWIGRVLFSLSRVLSSKFIFHLIIKQVRINFTYISDSDSLFTLHRRIPASAIK
jgi:peptidoglycan/LPS O-acetylase OafA/YrhL